MIFTNLKEHTHQVMDELVNLKRVYKEQSDTFIEYLKKLNE